jgi:hypothetical protein
MHTTGDYFHCDQKRLSVEEEVGLKAQDATKRYLHLEL